MRTGNHTTSWKAPAAWALFAVFASGPALAADPPDLTGVWGNYRPPGQTGPGPLGAPVPPEELPLRAERRGEVREEKFAAERERDPCHQRADVVQPKARIDPRHDLPDRGDQRARIAVRANHEGRLAGLALFQGRR